MDFAANFTAIDFETANRRADSACQLAAVVVRQGRIEDSAMWMIRPRPLYFSRAHIQIHGITPDRVRGEAEFGELWPEIASFLADDCLVAHNAAFDIGVLLACLRSHGREVPDIQFTCTRKIARRSWPHRRRYGLKPLSDWLGIRFRHHDALEDSIACAKVLLAAGIDAEAEDLPDLERRLRIGRGSAGPWGQKSPGLRSAARRKRPPQKTSPSPSSFPWPELGNKDFAGPAKSPGFSEVLHVRLTGQTDDESLDLQRLMIRADFIRPLSGQRLVFAGQLSRLRHEDALLLAARLGGDCEDSVTERTDVVVFGSQGRSKERGEKPAQARRDVVSESDVHQQRETAERLRAAGKNIRIFSENEFLTHCQRLLMASGDSRSDGPDAGSG